MLISNVDNNEEGMMNNEHEKAPETGRISIPALRT